MRDSKYRRERAGNKVQQRRAMQQVHESLDAQEEQQKEELVYIVQLWRGAEEATLLGALRLWTAGAQAYKVTVLPSILFVNAVITLQAKLRRGEEQQGGEA